MTRTLLACTLTCLFAFAAAAFAGDADAPGPNQKPGQSEAESDRTGWRGEAMPEGMSKSPEKNVYAWDTGKGFKVQMVYVPPGEFTMGSNDVGDDEKPMHQHPVAAGYYIASHETTWGEYLAFCNATGRSKPEAPSWGVEQDHPVVNVSWDDAQAFCEWAGLSLPTEPQWEKAARGTDGREFPWGDRDPAAGTCIWEDHPIYGNKSTAPVGSAPAGVSPFGAHDMAGNVWEWCADLYGYHVYELYARGRTSPLTSGLGRVYRGGCWSMNIWVCRAANRNNGDASLRNNVLGFRPAKSATR